MDLNEYRGTEAEKQRVADLIGLLPDRIASALDVGARDGFISRRLAERVSAVTALDLETPSIDHERIRCVKGNVTALDFPDDSFDIVLCAEVIEHISPRLLAKACGELGRVSREFLILGVPYKQDIRMSRSTCQECGGKNPPWGHVNRFDERRLRELFPGFKMAKISFVGEAGPGTNALSSLLMDWAGNPYGTYSQEEPCIHCGARLKEPPQRNLWEKILTKAAVAARDFQRAFMKPHPNWIHVLFKKGPR